MAPVADNYLQMPRPTNTYSERLDEFSGRSSEAFSNFEQLFLSTVVFQHIHQLQSRRQTLHDRQSTFTYPRTQFANSSAITANMVQMYTIFGRQVGSHYVSCPPSRSPARPSVSSSLRSGEDSYTFRNVKFPDLYANRYPSLSSLPLAPSPPCSVASTWLCPAARSPPPRPLPSTHPAPTRPTSSSAQPPCSAHTPFPSCTRILTCSRNFLKEADKEDKGASKH